MNTLHSLSVLAGAVALTATASAQLPNHCVESTFVSNNNGGIGWTVMFDVDTTEPMTISGLRTNVSDMAGDPVDIEIWTATTSFGNEFDPAAWTLVTSSFGTSAGRDVPTQFLFSTPIDLPLGTTGLAIVHTGCSPAYTNGTGSNEVYTSPDGHVTVTANAAASGLFTGSLFQTRVWNGNLCYDLGSAPCVETLFASNNGGSTDGAVYFNVDATQPTTISAIEVNSGAAAGSAIGIEVYTIDGSAAGNETNAAAWTLVATDDGTAISNGDDVPSLITLENSFQIPPGTTGFALVAEGFGHEYTNGTGPNQTHQSADDNLRINAGSATNVPFTGTPFSPRVWNGRFCADTADNCVETLFDANNGGSVGGAVYFDVVAAMPVSISGLTTNTAEAGGIVGMEMWVRNGTSQGNETAGGWNLAAVGDGSTIGAERDDQTPINFTTSVNLPAGRTGVALVFLGAGHDYTNGTGMNEIHDSQDNILRIEAGSATNVPFTGSPFSPRVWNGKLCYDAPFIGSQFCEANPNSTGETGTITAAGSNVVANNVVRLFARNLPNGSSGFFLTSQTFGFVPMPGGSLGNLCIAGPSIGRYVGPGQVQNSGGNGAFSLQIDLNQTPTPTGLVQVMPGDSWNFQCWHRDLVGGISESNFTNALRIQFQ